jgi:spore germination protein YaaH
MKSMPLLVACLASSLLAQDRPSIHQIQSEYYRSHPSEAAPTSLVKAPRRVDLASAKVMNAVVYGFHPYWQNGSEANYYFSLLTHLAYFSAEVNSTDGSLLTTRSWSTASVVSMAKQYGLKVHLTVTLFSDHGTLLNNTASRSNLIATIISQINLRNADGCNVDFEGISASNAAAFRSFILDLGTALKADGLELVVELPAVDWSGVFATDFFSTTASVVDYYFLMAYDYYWKGSPTAGPVAPLTTGTSIRHVTRSFSYYLGVGCPSGKLIGGFPYYGIEWPVTSSARMATTRSAGSSIVYHQVKSLVSTLPEGDRFFDATYHSPWYRYDSSASGLWRQGWYDDSLSLAMKYDSVKAYGLAGAGMWALGYDGTHTELWGILKDAFASQPDASHTSLDDFETGVGRFDKAPTWSGSTTGVSTSSSAVWTNDQANNGQGSLLVTLVDNTSVADNWSVRLVSGAASPSSNVTLTDGGYLGFWMRTTTAPAGAKVGLLVDDGAGGTEKSPLLDVINDGTWQLYQFNTNGSGWTSFSSGNGSVDGPTLTLDALYFSAPNPTSDWTFWIDDVSYHLAGPLPVQMTRFTITLVPGGHRLEWSTSTENDNYGFDVERRVVGTSAPQDASFETIGFVPGKGTSSSSNHYRFVDSSPPAGRMAYRLRQIDRNGSYAYSMEMEVGSQFAPSEPLMINAFPNPFNPTTTVEFRTMTTGRAIVRVHDVLGREVATLFDGVLEGGTAVRRVFDASDLSSGLYFVCIQHEGRMRTSKLVLAQ